MTIVIKGQMIFVDEILEIKCKKKDKFPIKINCEGKEYFIKQTTNGLCMNMTLPKSKVILE